MEILTLCEVGLRDGLQNEARVVETETKLDLLDGLIEAGLTYIETSSYVRPSAVPQMADSDLMMREATAAYPQPPNRFTGLVFNDKGYDRALASGCRSIAIAMTVTESFCNANNRMTMAQSMAISRRLVERAHRDGIWVRIYLSTAWVCPFEGYTPPQKTIGMAEEVWSWGIDELSIADTIGFASPLDVGKLMETLGRRLDMSKLAVHLHDTQAMGLANVTTALQAGVRIVDSSIGGLGGCPFAPGAAGNLATEDVLLLAYKLNMHTGVDLEKLMTLLPTLENGVGHPVGGRIRAWWESRSQNLEVLS
ncbi:MAG: hydroxymethylglutaryl-CoA lyase [Ardenticatenaceae bacterium]|nr:hydroxymethylglutaryl-CoA lyase [Ardenticatenaceae bacterium]